MDGNLGAIQPQDFLSVTLGFPQGYPAIFHSVTQRFPQGYPTLHGLLRPDCRVWAVGSTERLAATQERGIWFT